MAADDFPWEFQKVLAGMARRAEAIGRELPEYTSCAINALTGVLIVYHVGEEFDAAAFTELAEPGTTVVFKQALLSRAQRDHLFEMMPELRSAFAAAGVQITGWARSGDPSVTGFKVGYLPADAVLPAELVEQLQIYGPDTVTFTPGYGLVHTG